MRLPYEPGMAEKTRPLGVTVVGVLYLLLGILMALLALILLVSTAVIGPLGALGSTVPGIAALIYIVIALGFFKGWKLWWYLGIIFAVLGIIMSLFTLPAGVISIIINLLIIYYLFRPNVKSYFLD